jgi:hypothetical protein
MSLRDMFEMLNRLNHTPSKSHGGIDAKIFHAEKVNVVLRGEN